MKKDLKKEVVNKNNEKVKKEKTEEEKADMKCYACGFVHSLQVCPSCGTERRAKRSKVENSSGAMSEIDINGKKSNLSIEEIECIYNKLVKVLPKKKPVQDIEVEIIEISEEEPKSEETQADI